MTPEERLDKVEGDLARMREDHDRSIGGLRRLAYEYFKMNQADHRVFMAEHRAFMSQHQVHMAEHQALLVQHQVYMARHRARMAEIEAELQAERERRKGLAGRVDGIEEMTKFLRELLEGNLRPPGKPPETEN
jgi:hypothetical protein